MKKQFFSKQKKNKNKRASARPEGFKKNFITYRNFVALNKAQK